MMFVHSTFLFTFLATVCVERALAMINIEHLFPRQQPSTVPVATAIPTACQSTCQPYLSIAATCGNDASCVCTQANGRSLEACINCLVSLTPTAPVIAQGQDILNSFQMNCNGAVSSLSVSATGGLPTSVSTPGSAPTSVSSPSLGPGPVSLPSSTSLFPGQSIPTSPTSPPSPPATITRADPTQPQQTITTANGGAEPAQTTNAALALDTSRWGVVALLIAGLLT